MALSGHYIKYEALAQAIGVAELVALVPTSRKNIKYALDHGDKHLNTTPLHKWDRAVGRGENLGKTCPTCGHKTPPPTHQNYACSWEPPFTRQKAKGLSLAERVCVLKHVARYHYL